MPSLANALPVWRRYFPDSPIVQWIAEGVRVPFKSALRPNFIKPNRPITTIQEKFITKEINRLLNQSYIQKVSYRPSCVSPLGCVAKKKGKLRLILDQREFNSFCETPKFRYEDITQLESVLQAGDYLITIDLKDGFHHIPIAKEDQTYFGFYWKGQFYVWLVLPFGWQSSPYFFTKIVRLAVSYLRAQGIRIANYVDDFLHAGSNDDILPQSLRILKFFSELGFTVNYEKSSLNPSHQAPYLGFEVNTESAPTLLVPRAKRLKIRKDIQRAIIKPSIKARVLARVAGECIAVTKAILPGKLKLRSVYALLRGKSSWEAELTWTPEALEDLKWWMEALITWTGEAILRISPSFQIVTDASHLGWGAHMGNLQAQGFWNRRLRFKSSNFRELTAVQMALLSFCPNLKNATVQLLTDNITTVAYLNNMGGPSLELSRLAEDIWTIAERSGLRLQTRHLPGINNVEADQLSRRFPKFEWKLNPRLFQYLNCVWGPHTIDRFSSALTSQLPRFNSRYLEPGTSGVDALAQLNWSEHNNWVNPPFRLIPEVLRIIKEQKAEATLIAPLWPAQPWFPELKRLSKTYPIRIHTTSRAFQSAAPVDVLPEPLRNPRWKIFAWRLSGKVT